MPTSYVCSNCNYSVSLGWFHYHDFSSGFGSQTLLLCTECGTQHAIHHAIPADMMEEVQNIATVIIDEIGPLPFEVRRIIREVTHCNRPQADAILASLPGIAVRGLSCSRAQEVLERLSRVNALGHIELTEEIQYQKDELFMLESKMSNVWKACPVIGVQNNSGQFQTKDQMCGFCQAKGTLTAELSQAENELYVCPVCRKRTLSVVNSWIT